MQRCSCTIALSGDRVIVSLPVNRFFGIKDYKECQCFSRSFFKLSSIKQAHIIKLQCGICYETYKNDGPGHILYFLNKKNLFCFNKVFKDVWCSCFQLDQINLDLLKKLSQSFVLHVLIYFFTNSQICLSKVNVF